jgi:hypothetical protein
MTTPNMTPTARKAARASPTADGAEPVVEAGELGPSAPAVATDAAPFEAVDAAAGSGTGVGVAVCRGAEGVAAGGSVGAVGGGVLAAGAAVGGEGAAVTGFGWIETKVPSQTIGTGS